MSLYRFFTKAGMPSRVPSLSDKEIKNANNSTYVWIERAPAWAWLYSQVSRLPNLNPPIFLFTLVGANPPNLNPPIFLFTLVGANPPNLMPANFSGYTVAQFLQCEIRARDIGACSQLNSPNLPMRPMETIAHCGPRMTDVPSLY